MIDPRNGETFYVGKGKGNRVFAHINGDLSDDGSEKLKRIFEIRNSGFEVQHVIHRHGMDDKTAFEVEAALIEAYPGVTNLAGGHGNNDRGCAHSKEIIEKFEAQEAVITDKVIEILVNRSALDGSVYDSARFAWKLSQARAEKAEYVFAVLNGLILEIFLIDEWKSATRANFPEFSHATEQSDRFGFIGRPAPKEIESKYRRKRVPPRPRGAANPIRYHNI
nr:hypothetical protein [Cognatishimia sp. MH4019]